MYTEFSEDIIIRFHPPDAEKSSSGGRTPVRQLKKRVAQRRKGLIPLFTLSATELPDTSGIILMGKSQDTQSDELKVIYITGYTSEHAPRKWPWWQNKYVVDWQSTRRISAVCNYGASKNNYLKTKLQHQPQTCYFRIGSSILADKLHTCTFQCVVILQCTALLRLWLPPSPLHSRLQGNLHTNDLFYLSINLFHHILLLLSKLLEHCELFSRCHQV